MMEKYINANPESGKKFYQDFHEKGKIVMLNLLKFNQEADYSGLEHLKPDKELSGESAYELYINKTLPLLEKAGSRVIYYGKSNEFLIGPDTENWDAIILVEYQSVVKFMEFAQSKDYSKISGHRAAALADSRLLPSSEIKDFI